MMELEVENNKKTILSRVQAGGGSSGVGSEYLGSSGVTGSGSAQERITQVGAVV